jgi:hypothetical protein
MDAAVVLDEDPTFAPQEPLTESTVAASESAENWL